MGDKAGRRDRVRSERVGRDLQDSELACFLARDTVDGALAVL